MKLYDAARCPFCARVRIALAEKAIEYETVEIDLRKRPHWIYELNPSGKVPVLDDGFVLPESAVIMEYLDERYPEPSLLPSELGARGRRRGCPSSASTSCSVTITTHSGAARKTRSTLGSRRSPLARVSSPTSPLHPG
jgi:glutathione S-transferase